MKSKSMKFYIDMEILLKKIILQEVNNQYYIFDFIDISYFRFWFQLATSAFTDIGLYCVRLRQNYFRGKARCRIK